MSFKSVAKGIAKKEHIPAKNAAAIFALPRPLGLFVARFWRCVRGNCEKVK